MAKQQSKPKSAPKRASSRKKKSTKSARSSLKAKYKTAEVLENIARTDAYVIKDKVKKITYDGRGRPTVMTQEVVGKLENAFAYGSTVEEACLYAGIHRDTYYAFVEKNPDFSDRVDELREAVVMALRRTAMADATEDGDRALKILERIRKQEFSLRTEVAHSGEVVNRHSISPETEALIKKAMGGFARKVSSLATKKNANATTTARAS